MTAYLRRFRFLVLVGVLAFVVTAWPSTAEAQYWGPRFSVGISFGGYWYPGYGHWGPYWYPPYRFYGPGPYYPYGPYGHWGPWGGPYPYWGYPGYGYGPYVITGAMRLQVTPRTARVFVDGYAAGTVDDFDGVFQRLHVRPGGHEITLYLEGYRTVRRNVYFGPDRDQNVKLAMEPVAPGEMSEPPPQPTAPPPSDSVDPNRPPGMSPQGMPPGPPQAPPQRLDPQVEVREGAPRFGALSVAVQPLDAQIFVDGERWTIGEDKRLLIKLTEGRHVVEIKKEGFATYTETIAIGRDRTMTLNVSLVRN